MEVDTKTLLVILSSLFVGSFLSPLIVTILIGSALIFKNHEIAQDLYALLKNQASNNLKNSQWTWNLPFGPKDIITNIKQYIPSTLRF